MENITEEEKFFFEKEKNNWEKLDNRWKIISEHSRLMDKESVSISKHFWGHYLIFPLCETMHEG